MGAFKQMVATIWQDLHYGFRLLARNRGFASIAILTLAIAIGANTVIFSIINAVLIQPLPFPHSNRLVELLQTQPKQDVFDAGVSYPNFLDWKQQAHNFQEIAAFRHHSFVLAGHGEATYVSGAAVTSSLFPLLEAQPLSGRTLLPEDDIWGGNQVVVISEGLWRTRFGANSSTVGTSIRLGEQSFTIVGIVPDTFHFPYGPSQVQIWIPLLEDVDSKDLIKKRDGHYLDVVGRLKAGTSLETGQTELSVINSRLAQQYHEANEGWGVRLVPLQEYLVGDVRTSLLVLWGAVAMVLLIAAINLTNVLLARATARVPELALRIALGASRARLIRQVLAECVLLGAVSGALGFLLAYSGVVSSAVALPRQIPRIDEIRINGWIFVFTCCLSITTSILVGLVPALYFSKANLHSTAREGGRGVGASKARLGLLNLLAVSEISLAMMLLVGAGLFLRSYERLQQVNLGFEPNHVLTGGLSLPRSQYTKPEQWVAFYDRLIERLKASPGVLSAAAMQPLPPSGGGFNFGFRIEGRGPQVPGQSNTAYYSAVSEDYFQLLKIPLVQGRRFAKTDQENSARVCAISERFATRYFEGENPLGKRLIFGYPDESPKEIIGIVGDVKQIGVAAPFAPVMYVPYKQNPWWAMAVAVRTAGEPAKLENILREEVHEIDKNIALADVQPLTQIISASIDEPRFRTVLFGFFGVTALLLAALGVYGVISYSVSRRTRDFGIRMALGAQRSDVLWMVMRQCTWLTIVGLTIGLVFAVVLRHVVANLIYAIGATDPLALFGAAVLLTLMAFAACYVPARRATRVDPLTALRHE